MARALYYGEGLFETIKWLGENLKLTKHCQRLKQSAEFFGYPYPSYEEFLNKIVEATGNNKNLYVKFLLLYSGSDYYGDFPNSYKIDVIVKPLPKIPKSVKLCISDMRRHSKNPIFYHKTTNYLFNVLVKRKAKKRGFFDGIVLNEKDLITETSSANILIYKGRKFITPARESGLLWGTTIDIILEDLNVSEERINCNLLYSADYVFILNSIVEVVPVKEIEGKNYRVDSLLLAEIKELIKKKSS
ncbi:MAG TPA: aminodeoxychorismate lyase [Aquificaceae bacterium]|nr:aminodeoxychorismate lyase [Aquificaceae bacterium]